MVWSVSVSAVIRGFVTWFCYFVTRLGLLGLLGIYVDYVGLSYFGIR